MTIKKVYIDNWIGVDNQEVVIEYPKWNDVEKNIKELNGVNKTSIMMETEDSSALLIGGGPILFVVFASLSQDDEDETHALMDYSKKVNGTVLITTGGQVGDFSPQYGNSIARVLLAAKSFFNEGSLCEELDWKQE